MSTTSDAGLVAACAAVIDIPKAAEPDSFVLHAPLELLARAVLLERVRDEVREPAKARIRWLADKYEAAGPSADPVPEPAVVGADDLILTLAAAGHAPILASLRPRVAAVEPTF